MKSVEFLHLETRKGISYGVRQAKYVLERNAVSMLCSMKVQGPNEGHYGFIFQVA